MSGPGGKGVVTYSQDAISGDFQIRVELVESATANETYRIFLFCGPRHFGNCGYTDIGFLATGPGPTPTASGDSGPIVIPKCVAHALISGQSSLNVDLAHVDVKKSFTDTSTGLFAATPLEFDSSIGPPCPEARIGIDHDGLPIDINSGPVMVHAGEFVDLGLVLDTPPLAVGSWAIAAYHNSAVLQPVSCDAMPSGSLPAGTTSECDPSFAVDGMRSLGAHPSGIFGTLNLMTATYRAVGPIGSCTPVVLHVIDLDDTAGDRIGRSVQGGTVCIDYASADLDGDGEVELDEIVKILLGIFREYDIDLDLNRDGVVDLSDLYIAVVQYAE